jgi:hypothetical protein
LKRGIVVAVLLIAAGAAWWLYGRGALGGSIDAGDVTMQWRGTYHGQLTLKGRVTWCPVTRVGILQAVSGDTGVMIVFYERDSLAAGPHPVAAPAQAPAATRPTATAALRWLYSGKDTVLAAFRSETGSMQVRRGPGTISGDLSARMRPMTGFDTLVVRGEFRDLPIVTTAVGCS